ncbi:hypothetical protein MDAP_000088 [Mitosporidium daphniae]
MQFTKFKGNAENSPRFHRSFLPVLSNQSNVLPFLKIKPHEKHWKIIDVLIDCFLSLRGKKVFQSQTGENITIFEIKEPLTRSYTESFKKILNKELKDILSKTSEKTRALIIDQLFVSCWEKVRNVGYGASMKSPLPYPIPYSMANTPRQGRSFGNQLFAIAISIKFYLENEMKDLSEPLYSSKKKICILPLSFMFLKKSREKSTHSFSNISTI